MPVNELFEISDWKEYYRLLRQGEYYLTEFGCETIGFPVKADEEPVAFSTITNDKNLYDRSGKCKIIFNNDTLDEDYYGVEFVESLEVDISAFPTDTFHINGGRLFPAYSRSYIATFCEFPIFSPDETWTKSYLWRKKIIEELGIEISSNVKPEGLTISPFTKGFEKVYDCRPFLEKLNIKLFSHQEFRELRSFRFLTRSQLMDFPKRWGTFEDLEPVGYLGELKPIYYLTDELIKGTNLEVILGNSDIEPEDIILDIGELASFKDILNLGKKKITSLHLIGLLEDGRGVFKADSLKRDSYFSGILRMFYARERLI